MIKDVEYKILQYLIEKDDFVTIKEIAKKTNISERMVRYAIGNIEYIFNKNNIPNIKKLPKMGIRISLTKDSLELLTRKEFVYKNYWGFDKKTRIILYLLKSHYPRTIDELSNFIEVSRGTVSKYLNKIEEYLKTKEIELVRKRNKGIYIKGKEISKRKIIYDSIFEVHSDCKIQGIITPQNIDDLIVVNYFYGINIKNIYELIQNISKDIQISFADVAYYNIIINTCIMIKRLQQEFIIDIEYDKMDYVSETFEYNVAKKYCTELSKRYNIVIPKSEIVWITMQFLGANPLDLLKDDIFSNDETRSKLNICINKMVDEFEHDMKVKINNKEDMVRGLFIHMMPAINRIKYNIEIKNNLINDIKSYYPSIFNATVKVSKHIEEDFNIKLTVDEISYICLHFGAAVENLRKNYKSKKRVIVVCSTGIGTSKLLANRLKNSYEDIDIIEILSYNEFINRKIFDVDYVISTININEANVPIIVVNPLLNENDNLKLSKIFTPKIVKNRLKVEDFIPIIERNCKILDLQNLYIELNDYINNDSSNNISHIWDLINSNLILANGEFDNAKDAVRCAGELLLKNGFVNDKYVDSLVKCLDKKGKNGPYIVISNGIALPHAKPEDGVINTGFSIITLKKPIRFGHKKHDPVKLIIAFASKDNKNHIKALEEIVGIVTNKNKVKDLFKCENNEQIFKIISSLKGESHA